MKNTSIFVILLSFLSLHLTAKSKVPTTISQIAKAGAKARDKGDLDTAIYLFHQGLLLTRGVDSARMKFNLAACLYRADRLMEAWRLFREVSEFFDQNPPTDKKDKAKAEVAKRSAGIGNEIGDIGRKLTSLGYRLVTLEVEPPEANITVKIKAKDEERSKIKGQLPSDLYVGVGTLSWWVPPEGMDVKFEMNGRETQSLELKPFEIDKSHIKVKLKVERTIVMRMMEELEIGDEAKDVYPKERIKAWSDFATGQCEGHDDLIDYANKKVLYWQRYEEEKHRCLDMRDKLIMPEAKQGIEDKIKAYKILAEICNKVEPAIAKMAKEQVDMLQQEARRLYLEDLEKEWKQVKEKTLNEDIPLKERKAILESLIGKAPQNWTHLEEAQRLLHLLLEQEKRERAFVPSLSLFWGVLPLPILVDDYLFSWSYTAVKKDRPDKTSLGNRYFFVGTHWKNAILPRDSNHKVSRDLELPVPLSPKIEAFATNQDKTFLLAFRSGLYHGYPIGQTELKDLSVNKDRFPLAPEIAFDCIFGSNPSKTKSFGLGAGINMEIIPFDYLNPSFPYPGGIWRNDLHLIARFGDNDGFFDFIMKGAFSYRTVRYGYLPNTMFATPDEVAPFNSSAQTEKREEVYFMGFAPEVAMIIRPHHLFGLKFRWMPLWQKAPPSPIRSREWSLFHDILGGVNILVWKHKGIGSFLIDGSGGVLVTEPPLGAPSKPNTNFAGHFIMAWDSSFLSVHGGIQNYFDPASFYSDFLNLWMIGIGGRANLKLGSRESVVRKIIFMLDAQTSLPIWTQNIRAKIGRLGYRWVGEDIKNSDSRLAFTSIRLRLNMTLWRGIFTGVGYEYRRTKSGIGISGPFGEFNLWRSPYESHMLQYYLGFEDAVD